RGVPCKRARHLAATPQSTNSSINFSALFDAMTGRLRLFLRRQITEPVCMVVFPCPRRADPRLSSSRWMKAAPDRAPIGQGRSSSMQHRTFALLAVLGLVAALCAAPLRALAQDQSRTGTAGQSSGQSSGQSGMGQPGSDQMGGGQDRQSMQDTMQAIRSADTPDKLFLVEAALGSQAEMQLAQLAQQKSQDQQV